MENAKAETYTKATAMSLKAGNIAEIEIIHLFIEFIS